MVLALAGDSTMTSGFAPARGAVGPPAAPSSGVVSVVVSVRSVGGMAVGTG